MMTVLGIKEKWRRMGRRGLGLRARGSMGRYLWVKGLV
jgi:hypothetical protein